MEENKARFGHFSGAIRLIVFVILFVIVIFFIIRWVAGRRAENKARQAVVTSQNKTKSQDSKSSEKKSNESGDKKSKSEEPIGVDKKEQSSVGVSQVPSGISDSEESASSPNSKGSSVPNAGIGENILATAFMISVISFLIFKNAQIKAQTKSLICFDIKSSDGVQ